MRVNRLNNRKGNRRAIHAGDGEADFSGKNQPVVILIPRHQLHAGKISSLNLVRRFKFRTLNTDIRGQRVSAGDEKLNVQRKKDS